MIVNLLENEAVASAFKTAGYVLLAILILMIMITVHELGHYLVGKAFKFKINEFAIGMGPAIFKRTMKSGEIFSIRLFPFGGFCAFEGEDGETADENAFSKKKPWQRILPMELLHRCFIWLWVVRCLAFSIRLSTPWIP